MSDSSNLPPQRNGTLEAIIARLIALLVCFGLLYAMMDMYLTVWGVWEGNFVSVAVRDYLWWFEDQVVKAIVFPALTQAVVAIKDACVYALMALGFSEFVSELITRLAFLVLNIWLAIWLMIRWKPWRLDLDRHKKVKPRHD